MPKKEEKSNKGLTVKKEKNFSKWYTQIIEKAEITDTRIGIKGFIIIRPWAAMLIEGIYGLLEEELQKKRT